MIELSVIRDLVTIAGVVIALGYYIINIRNQKETRQAQLFMQIYSRWQDDSFVAKHDQFLSYEFKDLDDFLEKYGSEGLNVGRVIGRYYEGIGVLVKRGLVDISLVDDLMSGTIIRVWEQMEPIMRDWRIRDNFPQYGEFIEYLYHQVKTVFNKQHPDITP
jgi:hypothetical protein